MKKIVIVFLFIQQYIFAQNVLLNPAFGNGGILLDSRALETYLVILPNQKILCGSSIRLNTTGTPIYNMGLLEYNQDGTINADFGNNGLTVSPIVQSNLLKSISLQSDGKIVACGILTEDGNSTTILNHGFVIRFNADGSLDATFGTNGVLLLNTSNYDFYSADSVKIDSNGNIIVAGSTHDSRTFIMRIKSDSTIDSSFCNNGVKICNTVQFEFVIEDDQLTLLSDDSMLLNGFDYSDTTNTNMALVKYNSDGTYCSSFGINGILKFDYSNGTFESIYKLNRTNDNKFILSTINYDTGDKYLIKILADGNLDSNFGVNGLMNSTISSFVVLNDNKQLCLSTNPNNTSDITHFSRLNENGSIDASFNNNTASFDLDPTQYQDRFFNLKLQSDGNLITSGQVNSSPVRNTIVANILLNDALSVAVNAASPSKEFIYPNPNNGSFTIANCNASSIKIVDLLGQVVYNKISFSTEQDIKTNLKCGVYFVEITNENKSDVIKMIIE